MSAAPVIQVFSDACRSSSSSTMTLRMREVWFLKDVTFSSTSFRPEGRPVWHPWVPWLGNWLEEGPGRMCLNPPLLFQILELHSRHRSSYSRSSDSQGNEDLVHGVCSLQLSAVLSSSLVVLEVEKQCWTPITWWWIMYLYQHISKI